MARTVNTFYSLQSKPCTEWLAIRKAINEKQVGAQLNSVKTGNIGGMGTTVRGMLWLSLITNFPLSGVLFFHQYKQGRPTKLVRTRKAKALHNNVGWSECICIYRRLCQCVLPRENWRREKSGELWNRTSSHVCPRFRSFGTELSYDPVLHSSLPKYTWYWY